VIGSCTVPAPSTTTELAPCQTWALDSCNGNQTTYPSAGYDERKWQTPGKGSSDYVSSFQDYRELTGYADITYSSDRTNATVTVNAFARSCSPILYSFGGATPTSSNTYNVPSGFTGTLSVVATIPSVNATLTLDRMDLE
jgi:alpha-amylase